MIKDAPKEEPLYVGLTDTAGLRRRILESAKSAVETQRSYKKIQAIQDRKLAVRSDLARTMKDLRDELSKLHMVLPHREVKETLPVGATPVARKKIADSRVDKIEAALAEIEERLRSL